MNTNHHNTGALRPPPRPRSPSSGSSSGPGHGTPGHQAISHRSASSLSGASTDSTVGELATQRRQHPYMSGRPSTAGGATGSTNSLQSTNFSRPGLPRGSTDSNMRVQSPPSVGSLIGHRARQRSQGFFEPSLPHASSTHVATLGSLTASQIAAQAAMHHVQTSQQQQHDRKGSNGSLAPINTAAAQQSRRDGSPVVSPPSASGLTYSNGTLGGRQLAAASAAKSAFPRSPLPSPNPAATHEHAIPSQPLPGPQQFQPAAPPPPPPPPPPPEAKNKERSKMKLFSKPKNIGISKDVDKKHPALPSPNRGLLRAGFANGSSASLAEPSTSSSSLASSGYPQANASTSTLVPLSTGAAAVAAAGEKEKEKEKRHHFLSRQKQKLKEGHDQRHLPLSSASSNSQAVDPSAPQSLYSFAPASPGFSKSVSGLDLRHGGRALREKKKEEKAAAAASALTPIMSNSSATASKYDDTRSEFIGPSSLDSVSVLGPPASTSVFSFSSLEQAPTLSSLAFSNLGSSMGLTGITPDDAWPLLKARLLNIFEGEDLRTPIEDFNLLVSVHIRRCIQRRLPIVLVDDLRELLITGFASLAQTLRGVPDERLVPKVVEMWLAVFGTILPFIQAVFLPLDLEFRGHGPIMAPREAAEFWGATLPDSSKADERPSSSGGTLRMPTHGEELDVRRITLICFRDVVILPRHESLMAIFSRLSLDSINTAPLSATSAPQDFASSRSRGHSNSATSGAERPGTGGSLSPRLSSFNSQASTLMDAASNSSGGGLSQTHSRSRATSNTSAGSFGTSLPHLPSPLSQPPIPGSFPTSNPHANSSYPTMLSSISSSSQQQQQQQQQQFAHTALPSPPVPIADPEKVTETVARMLQCVSVLASVQTADAGQSVIERLTQALKYNWLGRGRTGRQRRGWVGMKVGKAGVVGA